MRRFFLLWTDGEDYVTGHQYYAEGLIHVDEAVYVRGFYAYEVGTLFKDIEALKEYLANKDYVRSYHIYMLDEVK
jgi:hypothetical protein